MIPPNVTNDENNKLFKRVKQKPSFQINNFTKGMTVSPAANHTFTSNLSPNELKMVATLRIFPTQNNFLIHNPTVMKGPTASMLKSQASLKKQFQRQITQVTQYFPY